jgi:hypothetical protein
MVASSTRFDFKTFLSPGQRFHSVDLLTSELTVARLVTDKLGLLHVTLRSEDGREISAFAEQVEAAIAEGHLMPVSSSPVNSPAMSVC